MSRNKKNYKLNTRYKKQSQRQLKVSQNIHTCLVECLKREGKLDQRLYNSPLSIVEVNISPDLKLANCFFVPFNTHLSIDELLDALGKSGNIIRHYIAQSLNLKYSPEICFYYDKSSENLVLIEELLEK